ncbi:MAG: dockerin type I domain-containing protein [Candidatus Poribacteria bacterium]|nr:dockerin type I domain-containing protein [Candidatus Poribacteria bacterium]
MKRLIPLFPISIVFILCTNTYAELPPQFLFGHTGRVLAVAFSPDGKWLASGGGGAYEIRIWDVASNEQIYTLTGHQGKIRDLAFRPNGDLASASVGGTVRLWNVPDQREIRVFKGHIGQVTSVAFSPDGRRIVSASRDRTLKLWDADTGELLDTFEGHEDVVWSVAFSPDGEMVVSGSEDGTVRLWNISDDRGLSQSLAGHTQGVLSVAFHPDGAAIASGSRDGTVRLWNVSALASAGGMEEAPFATYDRQVLSVRFSPDGRLLAAGLLDSPTDNTLKLWDVLAHRELRSFDTQIKRDFDFSPDRTRLAVAGAADGTVTIWNSSRLKPARLEPSDGTLVDAAQVALKWEAVEHAIYYDVELTSAPDFTEGTQSYTVTVNELPFALDGSVPSYWWRVRTGSFGGVSDWSEAASFIRCAVRVMPLRRRVNLGEEFPIEVWVESVKDLAGFQFDLQWTNPNVLEFVTVTQFRDIFGESGLGQQPAGLADQENGVYRDVIATTTEPSGVSGSGLLLGVLFRARNTGVSEIQLENLTLADSNGQPIHCNPHPSKIIVEASVRPWDVNRDGVVNIFDLSIVARHIGQPIPTDVEIYPDVNEDGVVDLSDFVRVGSHFGESYSADEALEAPSIQYLKPVSPATRKRLHSIYLNLLSTPANSPAFIRTLQVLRHLLSPSIPARDLLLQNYPNPFNPETWIPFHLTSASPVTIEIHDAAGLPVRQLNLGHLTPGRYVSRTTAAYWDGTNEQGEPVASGIYFYTLSTKSLRATRKMIIAK